MAWNDTKITGGTITAAEWNNQVTDQETRIVTIIEDTTPQLGGNLDIQAFNVETAVAADFVKLAGITSTVTELNYTDGVTSAIQTQLGTKAPLTSPTFTTAVGTDYLTASEIIISDGSKNIISAAVATYPSLTELTYVKGVSSAIQTQLNAKGTMDDVVDDTTPQLGGTLDENGKALTKIETAGESVVAGDLCYLKSDGKYWKADASVDTTADGDLLLCNDTIAGDATGEFISYGEYTTSGLTAGSTYYMSETAAAITATAPTTSTSIVRIIGYALTTTVLIFKADKSFVEVA